MAAQDATQQVPYRVIQLEWDAGGEGLSQRGCGELRWPDHAPSQQQ